MTVPAPRRDRSKDVLPVLFFNYFGIHSSASSVVISSFMSNGLYLLIMLAFPMICILHLRLSFAIRVFFNFCCVPVNNQHAVNLVLKQYQKSIRVHS